MRGSAKGFELDNGANIQSSLSEIPKSDNVTNRDQNCPSCADNKGKGYLYAVITAVLCPCHLPLVGMFLGGGAASVFFAQHFMLMAIILGILSLISFVAAVRILL